MICSETTIGMPSSLKTSRHDESSAICTRNVCFTVSELCFWWFIILNTITAMLSCHTITEVPWTDVSMRRWVWPGAALQCIAASQRPLCKVTHDWLHISSALLSLPPDTSRPNIPSPSNKTPPVSNSHVHSGSTKYLTMFVISSLFIGRLFRLIAYGFVQNQVLYRKILLNITKHNKTLRC